MQKIVKVPQLQVIDEVAKVPRSVQRQVPMIQEMQQDQKPEEVQMSFKMYVDRGSECIQRRESFATTSRCGERTEHHHCHRTPRISSSSSTLIMNSC